LSAIKRLAGETALYGLGSIVPRAINFFLTWLHTRVFVNPEEYGVITNLYAYVAFLNIIYIFGMETAFFRFATKPGADPKRIFNIAQTAVSGISIFLSLLFILFSQPIATQLNIPGKEEYIIWLALVMLFDAIVALPFARLRLEKKPLQYALAKITNVVMFVGLNFFFLKIIYNPEVGVGYVFLANLIANAFFVLFFIRTLLQWRPTYDKEVFPAMIKYAYPIMITGVAGMINEMFSRTTLELWLPKNFYPGKSSAYALGVFGACFKLAVIMNLAIQAFRFAAEPFFFSNAADKNSPALFARINHYFIIVCCIILLSVSINLDIFKYFLGNPKYWEGLQIVPILLLAYVFLGIYYNLTVWFKLTDKTYYGTMIAFGGAAVTILANYILIPIAGYVGSSWATLLCYASMTVVCYALGQKYFPIPYYVIPGLSYIVLTTTLVYVVNKIEIHNQWLAFGFHSIVICVYLLIIYLLEQKKLTQRVV
jgi:O-antigen/teichoic acid export membrane protein